MIGKSSPHCLFMVCKVRSYGPFKRSTLLRINPPLRLGDGSLGKQLLLRDPDYLSL